QLSFVTIGRGVQNYTCPSGATKPVQNGTNGGAVAQLFDVTSIIASSQAEGQNSLLGPLNDQFPKVCFHHFNAAGTPVFDCGDKGIILGLKLEAVDAPVGAQASANGAKAVPWLNLAAKEGSRDITKVIRVVTAGGSPPSGCAGYYPEDVISVDYAAQYWFFNNGTLSS
ncbi:hypothetical protein K491DRAFT_615333, partial [Lophiostoma macrostomum CBS 122681]